MCIYCGIDGCFNKCGCNDIDTADEKDRAERERGDEIRERKEIEEHYESEEVKKNRSFIGSERPISIT